MTDSIRPEYSPEQVEAAKEALAVSLACTWSPYAFPYQPIQVALSALSSAEVDAKRYRFVRELLDGVKFSDAPIPLAAIRPDPDDAQTKYICGVVLDYAIDAAMTKERG